MNKNIQKLLAISALAASIAACSSGTSSNNNTQPTVTATQIDLSSLPGKNTIDNVANIFYGQESGNYKFYFLGDLSLFEQTAMQKAANGSLIYSTLIGYPSGFTNPTDVTSDMENGRYTFVSEHTDTESRKFINITVASNLTKPNSGDLYVATWESSSIDITDTGITGHTPAYAVGESVAFGAADGGSKTKLLIASVEESSGSTPHIIDTNFA